jgi:magnesium transporter
VKIRAIQFLEDRVAEFKELAPAAVQELVASWEFCWVDIDITGAKESEVKDLLEEKLEFHPLTVEDCYSSQPYTPKADDYEDYQFYIFHYFTINQRTGEVEARELNVYVGRNYVITVHRSELAEFKEHMLPVPEYLQTTSEKPVMFLHHLLDIIVDAYISELTHVQLLADRIEEMILAGRGIQSRMRERELMRNILTLRQSLNVMRRSILPERAIVHGIMRKQHPEEEEEEAEAVRYLSDLIDQLERSLDILEHERDALANLMDLHITLVSNRTNEIIRILTIITVILMPLNLIAGIYGMNFKYMPEIMHPAGYPMVLLLMGGIAAVLLYFFRKRGWI